MTHMKSHLLTAIDNIECPDCGRVHRGEIDPVEGELYLYAEHGPVFSTREPQDNLRAAGILLPAIGIGIAALAVAAFVFFLR